ncbi:MAG: hypothetical protein JO082_14360 [Mycobacterium sp.]|nr:hypothetical protein [Mycobacterium sp.]MBV9723084.1 hypothetical protein [Mycobacterium sp.]
MDLESTIRLDEDHSAVKLLLAHEGGRLVKRGTDPTGLYWALLQPSTPASAPFIARINWTVYPDRPPSILFADQIGGQTGVVSAWPAAAGYRAPNDICKPFTAEGHAVHPEWKTGHHRWRNEGNPFLFVVETLLDDINRVDGRRVA